MPLPIPDFSARRAILWTVAAFFLAFAVNANDGSYSPIAMVWLTLAIVSALTGTFAAHLPAWFPDSQRALNFVLGVCALFFAWFYLAPTQSSPPLLLFLAAIAVFGSIGVLLVRIAGAPFLRRVAFPAFLLLQLISGVASISRAHIAEQNAANFPFHVRNDVQTFAQEAAYALSHGKNPYSLRMPNVMGGDMPFYSQGTTGPDGRLSFGYPYLPLSALWSLPGHWLGDFRLAHMFALIGAAFFLAYARPSTTSQLAATCFLLFPPTVFILWMSWIEPVAIFFLAATLFCYYRAPRWLFVALGCLIASKQYTFFMLALLPLLVQEKETPWPLLWKSVGVALLLTLPVALWDVAGFYRSVVEIQFKQPFRTDSLSYLVVVFKVAGLKLSPFLGFLALLCGLWWGNKKAPHVAAGWCSAGAVAYLGFFALNKQAFANYYFWPFSLLIAAIAVALPSNSSLARTTTPEAPQGKA